MDVRSTHQPLSRRLFSQFLMFGLLSIVVLALSLFVLDRQPQTHNGEQERIGRIKEIRSLILTDLAEHQGSDVQSLLSLLAAEEWVSYVCVVSADGKVTAHSKPSRIGQEAEFHVNLGNHEALIQRRVMGDDGSEASELLAALPTTQPRFGYLQVGLISDTSDDWLQKVSDWFSFPILGPLLVLVIGAGCLTRAAHTNAMIETQLCAVSNSPSPSEYRLQPLSKKEPTAQGWNRLVEQLTGKRASSNLQGNLTRSLENLQQKRFEGFLNALPDGVAVTDKDGCITYANRAFGVLLQLAHDAPQRGRPITEYFPANSGIQPERNYESRPAVFEVLLGKTHSEGVLRVGCYPQLGEDNSAPLQHVWTVRDVTQQKLAEEMRNQFVYSATHELRTPLANIKAYAETLTMSEITDPEQQKGFLNIINSEATRLGRFVEELLNISQMEAGSLSLSRQEVDMERLLTEVAEKVRPQMQQKQITFDTILPAKMPKLHVDKDKLVGALVNLLGNAAKYTPGNGRVTLKVTVGSKDVQISVEDTGFGISKEDLPKLFTKFFRSEDSRVRDVAGSGLGLSFAHEVTRHHGGKLLVHSELNKGSQFTVVLPIVL